MELLFRLISSAVIAFLFQITTTPPVTTADKTPTTESYNDFGFELTGHLKREGNLFISPTSIATALLMVYAGAKGKTSEEIGKVLRIQSSDSSTKNMDIIDGYLNSDGDYILEFFMGVFLQKGFPAKETYVKDLKTIFSNPIVKPLDFQNNKDEATSEINKWVEESTHGKIKNMLSGALDSSTRMMVLLNGIYFKAPWKTQFNKSNTYDGPFYLNGGKNKKNVKLMSISDHRFSFYQDKKTGYTFLEMPYKGEKFSMLLALPGSKEVLPELKLNSKSFSDILNKLESVEMETVVVPRFSIQYETDLKSAVTAMGIKDMFESSSDLSGIREERDLFVSTIIHKAVIDVNEEGSEAAAATAVITGRSVLGEFVADHPFLFYIVSKEKKLIFFAGQVMDPQ